MTHRHPLAATAAAILMLSACSGVRFDEGTAAEGAAAVPAVSTTDEEFLRENSIEQERYERDRLEPEDEAAITAEQDDLGPPDTTLPPVVVDDENWYYSWHADTPLLTFEQAIVGAPEVFVAEIVGVAEGTVWNTPDGTLGRRSEWADSRAVPMEWQVVRVRVDRTLRGTLNSGVIADLAYWVAAPGFHKLDDSAVGARILVGAEWIPVGYRDGTTRDILFLGATRSWLQFTDTGPALRFYDPGTGSNWKTLGGPDAPIPGRSSGDIARTLDEVVVRAADPSPNIEDHLGYEEIYRPADLSPTSDIVP